MLIHLCARFLLRAVFELMLKIFSSSSFAVCLKFTLVVLGGASRIREFARVWKRFFTRHMSTLELVYIENHERLL